MDDLLPTEDAIQGASEILIDSIKHQNTIHFADSSTLSQLQREAHIFDSAANAIYKHLARKAANAKRQINDFTFIHKLPNEITTLIFLLDLRDTKRRPGRRRELASVCHGWLQVFKVTPILWTDLNRADPDFEMALRWSQGALLGLQAVSVDMPPHGWPQATNAFLERMAPFAHRLQSFRVELSQQEDLVPLQELLRGLSPCLHTLLAHDLSGHETSLHLDHEVQASLRHVSLHRIEIGWGLSNLRSLEIFRVYTLPTVQRFHNILASSPRLEDLTLFHCNAEVGPEPIPSEQVLMPRLRSLHLEDPPSQYHKYIAATLRAPTLSSLLVELLDDSHDIAIAEGFLRLADPVFRKHPHFTLGNGARGGEMVTVGELGSYYRGKKSLVDPADRDELWMLFRSRDPRPHLAMVASAVKSSNTLGKIDLEIGGGYAAHNGSAPCCPIDTLLVLPTIRTIRVGCQAAAEAIIQRLGEVVIGEDGVTSNLCPGLERLDLRSVNIDAEIIDIMQARRINRVDDVLLPPVLGAQEIWDEVGDMEEEEEVLEEGEGDIDEDD